MTVACASVRECPPNLGLHGIGVDRLMHQRGNDNEVVLCPPNLGLKASMAEDVQQFIRAADNALCSIQWGRLGDRSVRFYDIGQHESSALRQPLRYTGK